MWIWWIAVPVRYGPMAHARAGAQGRCLLRGHGAEGCCTLSGHSRTGQVA